MKFEVFHRGLLGRPDVIAVDMIHINGLWGPCFSHHCPHNNFPRYAADTSTAGVLRFLGAAMRGQGDMALSALADHTVTTHHFDADALLPVWALLNPEAALEQRDLLERVARCGDFFIALDDTSTRLNFAIEALHQRLRGSGKRGERLVDDALTSACFAWMLPRWRELMHDPSQAADLWEQPLHEMEADREYLSAPGRVTELWDRHTSLVETDHALDPHALNSVCRNDLLLVWRSDTTERRLDVRPAIGWYDLTSIPHRPRYDLECLAARLNAAEGKGDLATTWQYRPGPVWLHAHESKLSQEAVLGLLKDWLDAQPEERVPAAYRADVREVFPTLARHAIYTSHERFAAASEIRFAPGRPYGGLHLLRQGNGCTLPVPEALSSPSATRTSTALFIGTGKTPLSFAVSDDFYWNQHGPSLELDITYVGHGPGRFWIEYDAWRDPYLATKPVTLNGDGDIHTRTFRLNEARFGNSQEEGGDLRLVRTLGAALAIQEIVLRKVE